MNGTIGKQTITWLMSVVMLITMLCGMQLSPVTAASAGTIMGDLNGDGAMTTTDVRTYLMLLTNETALSDDQKIIGDLNGDGKYNTADARRIVQMIVNGEDVQNEAIRAIWIPYMEVEELLVSGDPATCRTAIAACFDDCVARGANTVYFHVRPNSDAYYDSGVYQPNAKTAKLLAKGFDPLACAVELAHARGLKIEAWVNPYRIGTDASRAMVDATFSYSNRYYYVPSDDDVMNLVVSGVRELVNNYAIDGVQFDDYFYPSGSVNSTAAATFEQADYTAYTQAGGTMSIGDWRRSQVNELIAACYEVCHTRAGCVFGISPSYDFEANYDAMYADAATWAKTPGYVDYLAPQLYIGFEHAYAPFETALAAWDNLPRLSSIQMVAGLALYKTGLKDDTWAGTSGRYEWLNNNDIIARQIACAKALGWDGAALYSHQSFEVGSDRDATVANADNAAACEAWLVFQ